MTTHQIGTRVLGTDAARAVGRFRSVGPLGYRAKSVPDAPLRQTRGEAMADEYAYWAERDGRSITVNHTCNGTEHVRAVRIDRVVNLGCGCTRHEGQRCDGSAIHVLTGGCGLHPDEVN